MRIKTISAFCISLWGTLFVVKSDLTPLSSSIVYVSNQGPVQTNAGSNTFASTNPNPIVDDLAQTVSRRLQTSGALGQHSTFTIYQPYDVFFRLGNYLLSEFGLHDPTLAEIVAEAGRDVGTVTSKLYIDAVSYTLAHILYNHGVATADNVDDLSDNFVNAVAASAGGNELVDDESAVRAVTDGVMNVLKSYPFTDYDYDTIMYKFQLIAAELRVLSGLS